MVQASLGSSIASVQETASASASAIDGIEAKWGVKVQAMQDGRLALAGIEVLSGESGESAVVILADRLLIYKPDGSGSPRQIVTLGAVNGVVALGLDGSLVVDGSVVARALAAKTITAESGVIGDLAVNTLQLAGHAVTIPLVVSAANNLSGAGIGAMQTAAIGMFYMPFAGLLSVLFMASQGYSSGIRESYAHLYIDGAELMVVGGAMAYQTNIVMAIGQQVSAGNHTVEIKWDGADSTVGLSGRTLTMQGGMK